MNTRWSLVIGCAALVGTGTTAWAGVAGNGALSSMNNGASRDFTNGAMVGYPNGATTSYPNGATIGFGNGAMVGFPNGATIGFGNGASVSFPNGASSLTFPPGGQVVLPSGGPVTYLASTSLVVNGSPVSVTASSTVTYGASASLQFVNGATIGFGNGASVTFPNGGSVSFPNGASITFPNGASITMPNGGSISYPNGGNVLLGGYTTQAFLTSKLWLYPIGSFRLDPATWATGDIMSGNPALVTYQQAFYAYLQGALKKRNGDLPAGSYVSDPWVKGEYDPYDLIAFKYLVRAAAKSTTVFTLSYQRSDGTTVSESFPGGLGLCDGVQAPEWIGRPGMMEIGQPYPFLQNDCGPYITAAVGLLTQPVGINNSISIRNLAAGDHPAMVQWATNGSTALNVVNLIQPLPRKRGVALDPFAATDNRELESMKLSATGNSGAYAPTVNTQGGWAGGYALRCVGGQPVVLNLNKLKSATAVIPGTAIQQKAANLVLRVCKGVHGCNKNDADWVTDHDDYSGTDVWPMVSFTCGAGFSEIATADYSKYRFVYNWLVRAKDGKDAVSTGIATLCGKAPESTCRSTTANPTAVTANTAPATEAQIYTQREGLYFGNSFPFYYYYAGGIAAEQWNMLNSPFSLPFAPMFKYNPIVSAGVLYGNCDVRSVEPTLFGAGLPEPPRMSWSPSATSFPGISWPTSYRVLQHRPVSTDRSQYRREFCSSMVQTACIPCMQGTAGPLASTEGFLPMLSNGSWMPVNYTAEPWIAVAKDPSWREQPQYAGEAVPVEAAYYNATRVCAQQHDRGNQGYCFTDWQDSTSCSSDTYGSFSCSSKRYRDPWGAPMQTGFVLALWLPQPIQPTTTANAGRCPVGYTKGTEPGFTDRCFAVKANGTSCSVDDQCSSNHCECTDASCAARVCAAANAPVCKYCTTSACTATANLALAVADPQECETALACSGAGVCR